MKSAMIWIACGMVACAALFVGCGKAPPPVVEAPPPPPPPPPPPEKKPIELAEFQPVEIESGATATIPLSVARHDNAGPIKLRIEGEVEGLKAKVAEIPEGESSGQLEIKAASTLGDAELAATLTVHAQIGDQTATRPLQVKVPELGLPTFPPINEILLQPGVKRTVEVKIERQRYAGPVELSVEKTPPTVTCAVSKIDAGQSTATLEITAAAGAPDTTQTARLSATLFGRALGVDVPLKIETRPFQVDTFHVVTLTPGDTQYIELPVTRSSYKGPLKLNPDSLPPGVTIQSVEILPDQQKARVGVAVAADASPRVYSTKLKTTGGDFSSSGDIVVRIASVDPTYLPPELAADPETPLLRRGSIGGRLTPETKQALLDFYGGTPESEAAVMRGLKWLAAHQQSDGSWSLKDYGKGIAGCDCQGEKESGADDNLTAATAFGVLPFLGAGITHNRAPTPELAEYQKVVEQGLVFLARRQIRGKDKNDKQDGYLGDSIYAHTLGTIALCEAYGLAADDRAKTKESLRLSAQLAIKYLLNAQHAAGGGWRYRPGEAGDMSVTGWVFLAIRTAQLTGIDVLKPPLLRAARFVDSCAVGPPEAPNSRYAYTPNTPEKMALSAAGLLTRLYLGWKQDEPDLKAGAEYLMKHLPPESGTKVGAQYYYYYATQVLHHLEGPNFDLWNHRMREHLIRTQEKSGHRAGSWDPAGSDYGSRGGRMYSTAMAILTLEVYYRHLPMYRVVKLTPRST